MCVRTNARARVARVTGPGCEGAKRTAQRPGTAARAAGSARYEKHGPCTRTPRQGYPCPAANRPAPSAQRTAHPARRHRVTRPLHHYTRPTLTRLTPPTHPHTTSASGKHTHTRSARRALQPDGSALSRGQRGSPADTARRSAALFVFGPSLHRHPPGQGGPGAFCAFPAVCRAWRHAACAAGAQYLAAMQGRAQRCAALCGQPDNRPRCSLGSGLCALYGRCAASSVPSLYCGPGRLGVSMARAVRAVRLCWQGPAR